MDRKLFIKMEVMRITQLATLGAKGIGGWLSYYVLLL